MEHIQRKEIAMMRARKPFQCLKRDILHLFIHSFTHLIHSMKRLSISHQAQIWAVECISKQNRQWSLPHVSYILYVMIEQQIHKYNKEVSPLVYSVQLSSITQLCLTVFDAMDCSTPGFPVHHQLPELTQTHVHWVDDAIQPSHPLWSPFPPTFNLSQHRDLFKWVSSSHQVAKVLEFQIQHHSFHWTPRTDLV